MLRRYRTLPIVTIIFVAVNLIVFLVNSTMGGALNYLGGVDRAAIMIRHEYARLFYAMFLHANTAHLWSNMAALVFLGAMLEQEMGHFPYGSIYLLSGIGGNVCSLLLKIKQHDSSISIGASGALFGLDGVLLAFVLTNARFRNAIPPVRVVMMVGLSLYAGFLQGNVDNAAHYGGLVVGFFLGLLYNMIVQVKDRKVQF